MKDFLQTVLPSEKQKWLYILAPTLILGILAVHQEYFQFYFDKALPYLQQDKAVSILGLTTFYISDPVGKAKSVGMSEEGFLKAKELFERHFTKKGTVVPMPIFTREAKRRWDQVPEAVRNEILGNVWCSECRIGISVQLREGKIIGRSLVLHGNCKTCGGEVARVIEPAEVDSIRKCTT